MPYLYGVSDTKYNLEDTSKTIEKNRGVWPLFQFRTEYELERRPKFNHDEWPIGFRASPESLLELSIRIVNKLPLPSVYEWTYNDIRQWIFRYGYPQYMNTFRANMIWGRKLLFLDADALSQMNIKDFDHIKHITYGIRILFHFELAKFSQSISLPDEKPNELYLLWHTQTGLHYDEVRRSDLYRRMQVIRSRSLYLDHWDLLELWLKRERERKYTELVGPEPRFKLYECRDPPLKETVEPASNMTSDLSLLDCTPPCTCFWTEKETALPWRLHCLRGVEGKRKWRRWSVHENRCTVCIPPCECHWQSRDYLTDTVLSCLKQNFPAKFAPKFDPRIVTRIRPSLLDCWTRFSI